MPNSAAELIEQGIAVAPGGTLCADPATCTGPRSDARARARERAERRARSWHRALWRVIKAARPDEWYAYDGLVQTYSARGVFVTGVGPAVSATFAIDPRARLLRLTVRPPITRRIQRSEAAELALAIAGITCAMSMRVQCDREGCKFTLEAVAVLSEPRAATAATRALLRDMRRVVAHAAVSHFLQPNVPPARQGAER